jgi:hypothetical protein
MMTKHMMHYFDSRSACWEADENRNREACSSARDVPFPSACSSARGVLARDVVYAVNA